MKLKRLLSLVMALVMAYTCMSLSSWATPDQCTACVGTGQVEGNACSTCHGTGNLAILDLEDDTAAPASKDIEQYYSADVDCSYTDVTKVRVAWTLTPISVDSQITKIWNTDTLVWDNEDGETQSSISAGTAKFTLENRSSLKIDAEVSFAAKEGFNPETVMCNEETLTIANGKYTAPVIQLDTVVNEETHQVVENAEDFAGKTATVTFSVTPGSEDELVESGVYGTYTVTLKPLKAEVEYAITANIPNTIPDAGNPVAISENGTATLKFTAEDGYDLPNTLTQSNITNATFVSWSVEDGVGTLVISNPTDAVSVSAEVVRKYAITANIPNTISDAGNPVAISENGTATLKFTAEDGYALPNTLTQSNITNAILVSWSVEGGVGTLVISNPTGDVSVSTVVKRTQTAPAAPTAQTIKNTSVTLNAITTTGHGDVEYAYSTTATAPETGWQTSPTIEGLTSNTTYYFFARYAGNGEYYPSEPSVGTEITTNVLLRVNSVVYRAQSGFSLRPNSMELKVGNNIEQITATELDYGSGDDICTKYLQYDLYVPAGTSVTVTSNIVPKPEVTTNPSPYTEFVGWYSDFTPIEKARDVNYDEYGSVVDANKIVKDVDENKISVTVENNTTIYGLCTVKGCFVAGTKVTMADGQLKNIEDIVVGDKVMSYNVETGEYYTTTVAHVGKEYTLLGYYEIHLENGTVLKLTDNHPILTTDGFKAITESIYFPALSMDDVVMTVTGDFKIEDIQWVSPSIIDVYWIDPEDDEELESGVDDDSNDTHIADGVIVHNGIFDMISAYKSLQSTWQGPSLPPEPPVYIVG